MNANELSLKLVRLSEELEAALNKREKASNRNDISICDAKIDEIESEFLKIKKTLENISVRAI